MICARNREYFYIYRKVVVVDNYPVNENWIFDHLEICIFMAVRFIYFCFKLIIENVSHINRIQNIYICESLY